MTNECSEFSTLSGIDPSRMSEDDLVAAVIDHLRFKLQNGTLSLSEGVQLAKMEAMQKEFSLLECEKEEIEAALRVGYRLLPPRTRAC